VGRPCLLALSCGIVGALGSEKGYPVIIGIAEASRSSSIGCWNQHFQYHRFREWVRARVTRLRDLIQARRPLRRIDLLTASCRHGESPFHFLEEPNRVGATLVSVFFFDRCLIVAGTVLKVDRSPLQGSSWGGELVTLAGRRRLDGIAVSWPSSSAQPLRSTMALRL
jgi:hypothetical protein